MFQEGIEYERQVSDLVVLHGADQVWRNSLFNLLDKV